MPLRQRRNSPPQFTDYRSYKRYLREDFDYECVYCLIHENEFGGPRNFHVEHFRPKARFPEREVDYANLLYGCSVCNSFKLDDWPSDDPLTDGRGYLDPCNHDYGEHFFFEGYEMRGRAACAVYMVERLHLNRRQMVEVRRARDHEQRQHQLNARMLKWLITLVKDKAARAELSPAETVALRAELDDINAEVERHSERYARRLQPQYDLEDYR